MISFPPCKINLGLRILRKRQDGYHDLDTVFYHVPLTDILEIVPSNEFSFSSSGIAILGDPDSNLCVRAYQLLKTEFHLSPVRIHLHKIIPAGAGLGGGSSDAAYVLRLLNQLFELGISPEALAGFAARLGSDCPCFVYDTPLLGKGRGEILTPLTLSLKGWYLVLINPGIHVSTAEAFRGVKPDVPAESIEDVVSLPVSEWRDRLINDFEKSIFESHTAIRDIRDGLYNAGATYAALSGSGSSVFGIFREPAVLPAELQQYVIWKGIMP